MTDRRVTLAGQTAVESRSPEVIISKSLPKAALQESGRKSGRNSDPARRAPAHDPAPQPTKKPTKKPTQKPGQKSARKPLLKPKPALSRPAPEREPRAAVKRAYHHGNLRDALIEEGLRVLEEDGLPALSLRQIAQRLGVSQTAPLHHFEGKSGLMAALAAEGFRKLFARRVARLEGSSDAAERLMTVMTTHVEFAVDSPGLFTLMYGPDIAGKADFPELEEAATRSYRLFETCVVEYLDASGGAVTSRRSATLAAWTASHGLAMILMDRQNAPWGTVRLIRQEPGRIAREVFGIFIAGLAHHEAASEQP